MNIDLNGKVAVVMGGSRGIGAAIVRRLCQAGAAVAFTYAHSDEAANRLVSELALEDRHVFAIRADSFDAAAVEAAVERAARRFGQIDILINCAGVLSLGVIDDFPLEQFDRTVAINVRAVFVAVRAAVKVMESGGRIVTIGSMAADRAGFPGSSVYCMSKAAVAGMTRGLARDLAPRGITVNVVQPGPTETDMTDDPTMRETLRPLMPVGRLGAPAEIASLVLFLASAEAAFITGTAITADGGFTA